MELNCIIFWNGVKWRYTVEPLILATLNFGIWVNVIILDPVILAFLLPLHWNATVFEFSWPVIFANLPGSRNSRNKGHAKKTGFTVVFIPAVSKLFRNYARTGFHLSKTNDMFWILTARSFGGESKDDSRLWAKASYSMGRAVQTRGMCCLPIRCHCS